MRSYPNVGNHVLTMSNMIVEVSLEKLCDIHNKLIVWKPIPLTREILNTVKDLKWITDTQCIIHDFIVLDLEDNNWEEPSFDITIKNTYLLCVENFHELENLVQVILGIKLESNLPLQFYRTLFI